MQTSEMEVIQRLVDKKIPTQITLDIGKNPTVHIMTELGIMRFEGITLLEVLKKTEAEVERKSLGVKKNKIGFTIED